MQKAEFRRQNGCRRRSRLPFWLLLLSFCILHSDFCLGLEPDQLLLITNKNAGQGKKLAEFYAQKRHVPAGRILELNLPMTEEMPAEVYDREVVPVVRAFLRSSGLERKVTCLVTFYGMPIRVGARVTPPAEREELGKLQAELAALPAKVEADVAGLEKLAAEFDPVFKPATGSDLDALNHRADAALRDINAHVAQAEPPAAAREQVQRRVLEALRPLMGPMGLAERQFARAAAAAAAPSSQPATQQGPQEYLKFRKEVLELREHRYDADSRAKVRQLVRDNLGPFEYARLLQAQINYFQTQDTVAAFDSELALLWWEYSRVRWQPNPLHYGAPPLKGPPVMMVCRLDGPQSGTVAQIITTSLKAEAEGLKGRIVIDSRGLPAGRSGKADAYGQYDQTLRNVMELLRAKTKLSTVFDDRDPVLPAGSAKNVAVYMGWYSVDRYVPACEFVPGAVAFHLASFTMVTLKNEDPRCWVRGLLEDGAAATLGTVAEPYLQAFPNADDLFPLLFTGKLTLAECYWKSVPWTSWMLSLVGDPLYTPYKVNPALKVEDLPKRLRGIFENKPAAIIVPGAGHSE
jgi:uncharacterized protein (TIGR03790 family)